MTASNNALDIWKRWLHDTHISWRNKKAKINLWAIYVGAKLKDDATIEAVEVSEKFKEWVNEQYRKVGME